MQLKTPYLTVAITNACNFRCYYCSPDGNGGFGEAFGTRNTLLNIKDLESKLKIAEDEGIRKVRITGGEPLLVKGIFDVLDFLEEATNMEYCLATNGSLAHRFIPYFKRLSRLDIRISLDSLDKHKFERICGVNQHAQVIQNIRLLAAEGLLQRIAMVVTKDNAGEINSVLDLCEELRINLKLFDLYSTPEMKNFWSEEYSEMRHVKDVVKERAKKVCQIEYTKHFGIPASEYELESGIFVRIKDSFSGTRYNTTFCGPCQSGPCQEGLYTILYSSDRKLIPCRLSPLHFNADTPEQFREGLKSLISIFQESYHKNLFWSEKNDCQSK